MFSAYKEIKETHSGKLTERAPNSETRRPTQKKKFRVKKESDGIKMKMQFVSICGTQLKQF